MDNQPIAAWYIPLRGRPPDLEALALWFIGADVYVATHGTTFVFMIPASLVRSNYKPVHAFAEGRLALANGIGRLLSSAFQPVSLTGSHLGVDASGTILHTVLSIDPAVVGYKAGAVGIVMNDKIQPDPQEGAAVPLLRVALRSTPACDALRILARPTLTWSDLYLLYELVQDNGGGKMVDYGWISGADDSSFTRTANSYRTLGIDSRHGRDRGSPPAQPMPLNTAVVVMRHLALAWLQHL